MSRIGKLRSRQSDTFSSSKEVKQYSRSVQASDFDLLQTDERSVQLCVWCLRLFSSLICASSHGPDGRSQTVRLTVWTLVSSSWRSRHFSKMYNHRTLSVVRRC
ncbi:hypothetical protein RRG08_059801 [Elysia crispata]|uniref:Uncharacterized protein n=1 Tax=Elysia crispata TaxID=231223 RepID=A0AAE1BF41_9GAST|nr:hypothetical protein RRG08_059801 [Elysia crispata]